MLRFGRKQQNFVKQLSCNKKKISKGKRERKKQAFPGDPMVKKLPSYAGNLGSIPGGGN